jgi:hypothetical protein
MKIFKVIIILILAFQLHVGSAQDSLQNVLQDQLQELRNEVDALKPGNTNFMLRGYAHFGLNASKSETTFTAGSFNPIFLWRQGDRFLFESEWELEFEGNELGIGLEYTDVSYVVSKGLIIRAGKFLLPFGTFSERLHPAWINRLTSKPVGFEHHGIGPMSDVGVEVRGGLQVGKSKFNYAFYVVNGPILNDGTMEPEEAGMLHFENIDDNNKNKAFGGRIGYLPFSNSSLELGVSGYFAKPGAEESPFEGDATLDDINYKDVKATLTAFDLSYVKSLSAIKGILDIKGQYNVAKVSSATYYNTEDLTRYTFDNNSSAYYGQVSYRPALVDNEVAKNFELVGRYSEYKKPDGALWGSKQTQWAIGLNYWFAWRTAVKISYQSTDTRQEGSKSSIDQLFFHVAVGF